MEAKIASAELCLAYDLKQCPSPFPKRHKILSVWNGLLSPKACKGLEPFHKSTNDLHVCFWVS
ncbi:hypothetical protein A7K93_00940 [Candidatus Methylacidiphilum fumarolicum]|uniref:Uncharacterized protein n=2 Tax=Candidatus Methylacidiphilum fumarolicum TaxID=591154 RepID=I0JXA9_METFB|nr:hypothetical protein A7K73_04965 [Candidatus Methylacidiphilum fumarolicum]CCG91878.1 hypothetical protein MFUM_260008 [Methylacidiphilum fumariolicum SolV]TFE73765.1 hypothetical protein A7K72_05565 [Candidatus Methylacidiphilum fumarolicum]TFE75628.1 hypothetical protein A7K93_00940 [Candidatus Methylacidiphilum fumarolicum]TFE76794.1 hypothetical protein A7D33_08380 [Candidatus Methylacidiphilum fumarolicum]